MRSRVAKAEAEAARRAAREAEEGRRAVEEATLKAARAEVTVKEVICHETQTESAQQDFPRSVAPLFVEYLEDVVLPDGSRCTMTARVSGVPTPDVTWFKAGVPVNADNLDYKTSFDGATGVCRLLIEEAFVEDSANWSLRASNLAGYAESHAKLTVTETRPTSAEAPAAAAPLVALPLKDAEVLEGDRFEFRCRIEGKPAPSTSWFKNGICVDRSKNFTAGEAEGGDSVLVIDRTRLEDEGVFSLRAFNRLGNASTSANLAVRPLVPNELPTFEEPLCNAEVAAGAQLLLECTVTGSPRPALQWTHNGRTCRGSPSAGIDIYHVEDRAALKVAHAFPKAGGQYVCRAKNVAGEATTTATVTVLPIPADSDSEGAAFKPAFQVPLENATVLEGDDISLEAVIVGHPEPEVSAPFTISLIFHPFIMIPL